jgi:TonB-linked SusC/RagA family outer membrane protein
MRTNKPVLLTFREAKPAFRFKAFSMVILLLLQIVFANLAFSQGGKTVTGNVVDEDGISLVGVNVVIAGTTIGTVTNIDGNFGLQVSDLKSKLIFSFVGYLQEEVALEGRNTLNIKLKTNQLQLDEIVSIGYGVQKKSNVTAAISSVKGKDVKISMVSSPLEALQGKAAGVDITPNSYMPGSSTDIRIRGVASINGANTLYVVDGIPLESNSLSMISPGDIESIEILKDASAAAIYGHRGVGGVILVTTKRGKKNKTEVSFDMSYGMQQPFHITEMANATEYANITNRAIENDGGKLLQFNPDTMGIGTNWINEITRIAPIHNYNLSVSGGSDKLSVSSSFGYFKQEGIVKKSGYDKFTGRLSADYDLSKKVKFGANFYTTYDRTETINDKDSYGGIIYNALSCDPIYPVYLPLEQQAGKNEFSIYHPTYGNIGNPVAQISRNFHTGNTISVLANVFASIEPVEGLIFRTSYAFDSRTTEKDDFWPSYAIEVTDSSGVNGVWYERGGSLHHSWENTMNYTKAIGKHDFGLLLGYAVERSNSKGLNASHLNLPSNEPSMRFLFMGTDPYHSVGSWYGEEAQIGYLLRATYNYSEKYLLMFNVRRDGNTKFPAKNKFGVFPGVSGAWIVNKEPFMQNIAWVSQLKLRAGYGSMGNAKPLAAYKYTDLFSVTNKYVFGRPYTENIVSASGPVSPGNPDLKWETVTDLNVGIDASLLDGKVSLSADWYNRTVIDMIWEKPLSDITGVFESPTNSAAGIFSNIGSMLNRGLDLTITYNDKIGELNYAIGVNGSTVHNEVLSLGDDAFIKEGNVRNLGNVKRTEEGRSVGEFYGLRTLGIFQNQEEVDTYVGQDGNKIQPNARPGDLKYLNLNDDSQINADDYDYLGSPLPKFNYGFNMNLDYKGFDLAVYFYGVYGNKILDALKSAHENGQGYYNSRAGLFEKAWYGEGSSDTQPRLSVIDANGNFSKFSDFFLSDGSYFRLKNLQLGYTFPVKFSKESNRQNIRVYLGAQNLFTLTGYKGFDPVLSDGNPRLLGIDYGNYPSARTFMIGTKINF